MKIISWNVNGLRAVFRKGLFDQVFQRNPDIICLQETKAQKEQLPPELQNPKGYFAYFDHPKIKKGYSGVASFTKIKPVEVSYEVGVKEYDQEGRLLTLSFNKFVLLNVYFPNGGGGPDRLRFKLEFYEKFLEYIEKIRKEQPNIIFCGDVNTAHKEIDLARPKENVENTGFLPVERAWIDKVIGHQYIDTFRALHPDKKDAYTYWDMKTFARERNVGWRIDYFFVSKEIFPKVKKVEILDNILGSDHCPIEMEIDIKA
jgi:exodeoxyribonuclease-3